MANIIDSTQIAVLITIPIVISSFILQFTTLKIFNYKFEIYFSIFILYLLPNLFIYIFSPTTQIFTISVVLSICIASAYLLTFPALKEDIPTFRILLLLDKKNMAVKSICDKFDSKSETIRKIDELKNDGLITYLDSKILLTNSGVILAKVFKFIRKIYSLN